MRRAPILAVPLAALAAACAPPPPAPAAAEPAVSSAAPETTGRYRLSGERALRPVQMSDDGLRTYIVWGPEQALPAVFAVTATGAEEIADGHMRDGVFTIDRVHSRLIFRIDKKAARAERIAN